MAVALYDVIKERWRNRRKPLSSAELYVLPFLAEINIFEFEVHMLDKFFLAVFGVESVPPLFLYGSLNIIKATTMPYISGVFGWVSALVLKSGTSGPPPPLFLTIHCQLKESQREGNKILVEIQ